jgi:glycine/D-amino acid oxidase-like deaminating enzyme
MKTVDYIIIGQGIAGSLLAWELIQLGKEVIIVDNGAENASRVAAGLFNPVTGRRMTESWRAKEFLPVAGQTYGKLESALGTAFYHPMPMVRLFPTADEREANLKRLETFSEDNYVEQIFTEYDAPGLKPVQSGACIIKGAGYLDTETFLSSYRTWLKSSGRLLEREIKYADIKLSENGIALNGIDASGLIFCEGYKSAANPWFSYLPWNLCKGELLTIKAPGLSTVNILSRGIYIVPLGGEIFRVGATYSWDKMDAAPTSESAKTLTDALDAILEVPYEIIDQKAGVRPTVRTRRPFLGRHPEYPQLAIFNGLGTKGVVLAPFFAKQMAGFLAGKGGLDKEVDIAQWIMSNKQQTIK